ncbi:MAG: hypothetical protein M0Z52_03870 [Actinomycetota bacterium]|nr:hypothetical protein [Actinomycetota bacterium]
MLGINPDIAKALISAGGGLLIALVILIGLYRLANKYGGKFIEAQQAQAEALGRQAQSLTDLQCSAQAYFSNDNREHREILILQKLTFEKLENLDTAVREDICKLEGKIGR